MLDTDKPVLAFAHPDQFIQLGLNGHPVAILRVLDKEHHEEGHDRRARVDDQLPCVGETKKRTAERPKDDDRATQDERDRFSGKPGNGVGGCGEDIVHGDFLAKLAIAKCRSTGVVPLRQRNKVPVVILLV